jgi:hypothetical protein
MKKFVWLPIFFLLFIGCETSGLEEIPLAPTELKATVASTNQVELSWKDNSTNETAYKIERKIGILKIEPFVSQQCKLYKKNIDNEALCKIEKFIN